MTGGVVYTYQGSWCAEGLNTSWECSWRFGCERGSVTWDERGVTAEKAVAGGGFISSLEPVEVPVEELPPGRAGQAGNMDDFLRAVREGVPPETICIDNIKSLAMVHAAIASANAETTQREAVGAPLRCRTPPSTPVPSTTATSGYRMTNRANVPSMPSSCAASGRLSSQESHA